MDAAPSAPSPAAPTGLPKLDGVWERKTEPYAGMQVEIGITRERAIVTVVPRATPERVAADAGTMAQLECQAKLWKPGDVLIKDFMLMDTGGNYGTIVVRDWGLTSGVCRHSDSKAQAQLIVKGDELSIIVTRGKTVVTQTWTRVAAAPPL